MEPDYQSKLNRRRFLAAACATTFGSQWLCGDEVPQPDANGGAEESRARTAFKTVGGKQLWADEWFFHDWRIQRHVLTGHCRLLDGNNRRHTWGSFDTCRSELQAIRKRDKLPDMQGRAVVVLHGLFRTRSAMKKLCLKLAEDGHYATFNVGYPTTRGSVGDHARSLDRVISSLEGIGEINFVGHSLGNLVVRHWLADFAADGRALPSGQAFGRMVMLAPPNHRPQIAKQLLGTKITSQLAGAAAEQLATGWADLAPKLATPPFEFGILAGGRGDERGYNPLIPGDDDGVVTVESTRLVGASDFRRLPALHSFFMDHSQVHEFALRFLEHGYFEEDTERQPVLAAAANSPYGENE